MFIFVFTKINIIMNIERLIILFAMEKYTFAFVFQSSWSFSLIRILMLSTYFGIQYLGAFLLNDIQSFIW